MLYYQRFTGNYYPSYSASYPGISESWPSNAYVSGTSTWDCGYGNVNTEFCGWGGWTTTGTFAFGTTSFTSCGKYKILGGYNILSTENITKSFASLPSHTSVIIQFDFFKIDSWDDEYFYLYVDTNQILSRQYAWTSSAAFGQICGSAGYNENIDTISETIAHTASTLQILFATNLDSLPSDESYGLQNFKVFLVNNCHGSCVTCSGTSSSSCLTCPAFAKHSGTIGTAGSCTCMNGFFLETSPYTKCELCDTSCKTCSSATVCTSCFGDDTTSGGLCSAPTSCINKLKNNFLSIFIHNFFLFCRCKEIFCFVYRRIHFYYSC